MLRMTAISAGVAGAEYLLRAAGCAEHDHAQHSRDASSKGAEYLLGGKEIGEPDGKWAGNGLDMLGVSKGEPVTAEQMRAVYGRLEHWEKDSDGEAVELGRRPRKYESQASRLATALAAEPNASEERQEQIRRDVKATQRQAVGYYDLTFSPVKSVSVYRAALEAAGKTDLAKAVTEAHNTAVREALDYIESHVTTTRVGRHSTVTKEDGRKVTVGEYAKTSGLVMTLWEHSSSRDGDPHIHTHGAILNRTMTADGSIYAVDGQQFKPLKGSADVIYERRVEELVTAATGARFAWRADGKTREILGVDRALCDDSSGRRDAIEKRFNAQLEAYRNEHGREPGRQAVAAMRREAWANTRQAKTIESPEALAERYANKHGADVLKDQVKNVADAAAAVEKNGLPSGQPKFSSEDELLVEAVRRTQELHATWDETGLALELNKLIGEVQWGNAAPVEIDRLVARALSPEGPCDVLPLAGQQRVRVPETLREGGVVEGQPIYRTATSLRYATRDQISAEKQLVAEANLTGGPKLEAHRIPEIRAELVAKGLDPEQVNSVIGIMTDGKAAATLIGPAGTGKSTTVGELDRLWRREFGAPVMGLATSQRATDVLAGEGLEALNTAAFLTRYMPEDGREPTARLQPGTMIVIDEAGMADTDKVAKIARLVREAGGKPLYTGDHEQLAAVGAGGLLDLMVRDSQPYELAQVHRLKANPWEQEASLKFRVGDAEALAEYERHGRLRGGTKAEMAEAAVRGYMADVIDGRDTVLVVKTNEDAADISRRVRDELVALGKVDSAPLSQLMDGNVCGVGDVLQARKIDHHAVTENGRMVVNRELLTVMGRDDRGRLEVRRQSDDTRVWLQADYVEDHATLAYAGTVHSVQGRTTDTSHSLVERGMSRNSAYVEGTRGRFANFLYAVTESTPDAHDPEAYNVAATDILREVLATDGGQVSATETYRAALESADSLQEIGAVWSLASRDAMRDHHHDILLNAVGPAAAERMIYEDGHDRLMSALQHAEMSGHDVERVLTAAVTGDERKLDSAENMSAALRGRVRKIVEAAGDRPVPGRWTRRLRSAAGVVSEYAQDLGKVMDERTEMMARSAVIAPPDWALVQLGPIPAELDMAERQQWAARVAAVGTYREMYGISPEEMSIGQAPGRDQDPVKHVAWHRAWEALGRPEEQADHQTLPSEKLQAEIKQWQNEQEWAPLYVAPEMQQAIELAEEFRRESTTRWAQVHAEAEATQGEVTDEVQQLIDRAARADRMAERYAESAQRYERLHEARDRWAEHTAELAERAALATDELDRRGELVTDEPRQLDLFTVKQAAAETNRAVVEQLTIDDVAVEPERQDVDQQVGETEIFDQPDVDADPDEVELQADPDAIVSVPFEDDAEIPLPEEPDFDEEPDVDQDVDQVGAEPEWDDVELLDVEFDQDAKVTASRETDRETPEFELRYDVAEVESEETTVDGEERGDYGTKHRLDELPEADASYPAPAEVDPNQQEMFLLTPEVDQRVSLGQVREDVDLTIADAELRAELAKQKLDGREKRDELNDDRGAVAEDERRRTERARADRDAQAEEQQKQLRDLSNAAPKQVEAEAAPQ